MTLFEIGDLVDFLGKTQLLIVNSMLQNIYCEYICVLSWNNPRRWTQIVVISTWCLYLESRVKIQVHGVKHNLQLEE